MPKPAKNPSIRLHPVTRYAGLPVLCILLAAVYITALIGWYHERQHVKALAASVNQLAEQQHLSINQYTVATIAPSENAVYLPLARLKLPATPVSESLVYNFTDAYHLPVSKKLFPSQVSLSTHNLATNGQSTTQQFDCGEVAYGEFVTPSYPVNPMFRRDGSVRLSDGRTMTVYYAPDIPGCAEALQLNGVSPKAVADALLQAKSY